jgi:hypothetical protein
MCGAALEANRSRPETATPGVSPASEVDFGDGKPAFRQSKRRRATLPASAPPPIPQAYGFDYALGNGTATKRAPSAV